MSESEKGVKYVVGFLFSWNYDQVVLIQKTTPSWQRGLLNGVGGKVEDGETCVGAMIREFKEEAGTEVTDWKLFCTLDDAREWSVDFYYARQKVLRYESKTPELVSAYPVRELPHLSIVQNLRWLVPMAATMSRERCDQFIVTEVRDKAKEIFSDGTLPVNPVDAARDALLRAGIPAHMIDEDACDDMRKYLAEPVESDLSSKVAKSLEGLTEAVRTFNDRLSFSAGEVLKSAGPLPDDGSVARAVHRIVRGLHDGECPACQALVQPSAMRDSFVGNLRCRACGFSISKEEEAAAIKAFAPAMKRSLEIFEKWRADRTETFVMNVSMAVNASRDLCRTVGHNICSGRDCACECHLPGSEQSKLREQGLVAR